MSQPLKGLKVLDFTTLLPGPYATQLLADMGAEVVRIESPTRPDLLKVMPPYVNKVSASHATINRNKKSVAVDLKHPEAKDLVYQLVEGFDIVIEQFRPGVMDRLGLGYEHLRQVKDSIIYCSITGYGQTGPHKDRAGHDINYLALSGLASYSGDQGGPCLSGTQIADVAGGSHHAVMSILAAVIERYQTGKGQYLDISMTDAAFALNTMFGANALANGKDPECGREMLNGGLFYNYYQTADDRYLSVGSLELNFAMQMLKVLGLESWMSKVANHDQSVQLALRGKIEEKIKQKSFDHWVSEFKKVDACVEPVLTINEAASSELIQARNMVVEVPLENGELIKQVASPLPFKRTEANQIGPILGADTIKVLIGAGVQEGKLTRLLDEGCVKDSS